MSDMRFDESGIIKMRTVVARKHTISALTWMEPKISQA